MHSDATLITYTDFGQNTGRYKTTESANALLQHIRQQEGGVTISYTGGQKTYIMPHGMIDFGSTYHDAAFAAISPSAVATCAHNYTSSKSWTSYFSGHVYGIGDNHAVKYKGIEIGEGYADGRWNSDVFSHALSGTIGNGTDHKIMRLSKVVTDAPYAEIYDTASKGMSGLMYYHAGSGQQWLSSYATNTLVDKSYPNNATQLASGYTYVVGGIVSGSAGLGGNGYYSQEYFGPDGINSADPLTWVSRPGDSGSPLYVWDAASGTYQYIGSNRGEILSGQVGSAFVVNTTFDKQVVEKSYTKQVNMASANTVYLNAVSTQGEAVTDSEGNTTTKWLGTVTGEGLETVSFVGLKSGLNTWSKLNGLKDTQAWYAYDESYVAQSNADLFFTENLVFNASAKDNRIVLNDTVDLGIGYAEFNGGKFTIASAEGKSYLFNHAGYVINAGAEVHLQLTNPADYMREWRKIGAGHLYIEGSGNNDVLLNLGGSGKTYLNRTDGYAAYNVLVNTGATVVISDTEQIKRDLTFGNRGGTLDMNGNTMDWYTTAEEEASTRAGFSINALTEDALVANYSDSSTLTYKEAGDTTYAGSFADSDKSSLKIVYDVAKGSWTLNSIRTNLQHEGSGLQVDAGRVILSGTNTVHGTGSATGRNTDRYSHEDDWHYADARMQVRVTDGGTFELGSHARLTGDVTVDTGGTYVMREGVRHTMEYVEGGQVLEDTGKYSAYFGHKGNVVLNGGTFAVQFNDGVDSTTSYAGSVTGTGAMTVDAGGDGGIFSFGGKVDATVSKTLNRGQLQLTGTAAADTAHKWLVNAGGVMVQFDEVADTLSVVDSASTGTLGLNRDSSTQVDLSTHSGMNLGALAGTTVQYGTAGTAEQLDFATSLGGGGGRMEVNFALAGSGTLNLDGKGWTSGEVVLNNVTDFSGTINVQSEGGRLVLSAPDLASLSSATVNINSGGVFLMADDQNDIISSLSVNAGGILQGSQLRLSGSDAVMNLGGSTDCANFSVQDGATLNVLAGGVLSGQNIVLSATMNQSGGADYDSFVIQQGGVLNIQSGGRLDADTAVEIQSGGRMNIAQGASFQDKVSMTDGGVVTGAGATIAASAEVLVTEGSGTLSAGGGTLTINGQIGAKEGAKLVLTGDSTTLWTSSINRDGGTLEVKSANLKLGHDLTNGTQTIGGKLLIGADVTINATLDTYARGAVTHNINELAISDGYTLTIKEHESTWAQTWNIAALTGEGNIVWDSSIYWPNLGTSKLRLQGNNSFTGTLEVKQRTGYGSMQHLSLEHDYAAQNITVILTGDSDSRPGLAISTDAARVAGIGGTDNTFVYAGAVKTAANGDNPTSSALNTLIINTGEAAHTYNGTLLGDSSHGLNIVKDGTGTQTFTNAANVVHDVTALQGHLEFTNAPTLHGNVAIAQGAQMTIGGGDFSLNAGKVLHVLGGSEGASAVLNNSLVLNGGILDFGAYNSETVASLTLGTEGELKAGTGISSVSISFSNQNRIVEDTRYLLMDGDWSGLSVSAAGGVYLDSALENTASGLYATFHLKDGYHYWSGTPGEGWAPGEDTIVFTGVQSDLVSVASATEIARGVFDNSVAVTIAADTAPLKFGIMEKYSGGELIINSAVTAERLKIGEAGSISGSASLDVATLELQADLTTRMGISIDELENTAGACWTLDGTTAAFEQQLTVAQVNKLAGMEVQGQANLLLDVSSDAELTTSISGSGSISKGGSGTLTSTGTIQAGVLKVNSGTYVANGAVDIASLEVASSATVQLYNATAAAGKDKKVGVVRMADGAVLEICDKVRMSQGTTIGGVLLHGEAATVQDSASGWNGYILLESLSLADGVDSGTLNLIRKSSSQESSVFVLGAAGKDAGNFAGNIVLQQESSDAYRSAFIVLGHEDVAENAILTLAKKASGTAYIGVGINADNTTIAGLNSASGDGDRAKLFSGTIGSAVTWCTAAPNPPATVGAARRTLIIDTAAGTDADFHGAVLNQLNLVKQGEGKQTFSGSATAFDGSIDIQAGTLGVSASALDMLRNASSINIEEGAVLSLSGFSAGAQYDLRMAGNLTNAGMLELDYSVSDNGSGFKFTDQFESIRVKSGRVQLNLSVFDEALSPTLILASSNSQLVFNGNGTVLRSDIVLDAATTIHVNSGKDGEITGSLSGNSLTKAGSGTLTLSGSSSIAGLNVTGGKVCIAETGRLDISTEQTAGTVTVNGIEGAGTLGLALSNADYDQTLKVAADFTGTTYVQKGCFTINDSVFGSTLRLADKVNFQLTAETTVELDKDLVLDGTSQIHQNSSANLTIGGTVSGEGTYERRGGGTLEFNNTVVLGGFNQTVNTGTTKFNADASIGDLTVTTGSLNLAGDKTLELSGTSQVTNLDAGKGGSIVALKSGASLAVNGTMYLNKMTLEERASFTRGAVKVEGRRADSAIVKDASSGVDFSTTNHRIENADVTVNSASDITLASRLLNSSVENAGSGVLTVSNSSNALTGVVASKGNVTLHHMGEAMSLDLLEIDAGKTVNAYVGTNAETKTNTTTVTGSALLSGTATLNTSLTLAEGATLEMTGLDAGAVTLRGALNLQTGLTLSGTVLEAIQNLKVGESCTLFTGVEGLNLQQTITLFNMRSLAEQTEDAVTYEPFMGDSQVAAADYFSNLNGNSGLVLDYNSSTGAVSITYAAAVPEPATATLSLLALAGLCARRRRKS